MGDEGLKLTKEKKGKERKGDGRARGVEILIYIIHKKIGDH